MATFQQHVLRLTFSKDVLWKERKYHKTQGLFSLIIYNILFMGSSCFGGDTVQMTSWWSHQHFFQQHILPFLRPWTGQWVVLGAGQGQGQLLLPSHWENHSVLPWWSPFFSNIPSMSASVLLHVSLEFSLPTRIFCHLLPWPGKLPVLMTVGGTARQWPTPLETIGAGSFPGCGSKRRKCCMVGKF